MIKIAYYFKIIKEKVMLFSCEKVFGVYRDAVVSKKYGPELMKTVKKISERGYIVNGRHYKKTPRGYDASHENAELLLYNGLHAMVETKIPKEFYSKAIIDYAFSRFNDMLPLHRWLRGLLHSCNQYF